MFYSVIKTVAGYIKQSKEFNFLSDGERRYGNRLFDLCSEQLVNDEQDNSPKTLSEGVRVRIKNKRAQKAEPDELRQHFIKEAGLLVDCYQ